MNRTLSQNVQILIQQCVPRMIGYSDIFEPKFRRQVGFVSLPGVSGIAVFTTAALLQLRILG
jgi:hypothetical protein